MKRGKILRDGLTRYHGFARYDRDCSEVVFTRQEMATISQTDFKKTKVKRIKFNMPKAKKIKLTKELEAEIMRRHGYGQ